MHVPNLAKNMISVEQIVEQGMYVPFNNLDYFLDKHKGQYVALKEWKSLEDVVDW